MRITTFVRGAGMFLEHDSGIFYRAYQRANFIEKGGWDKMPGQEKAGYFVARACADGLDLLIKK